MKCRICPLITIGFMACHSDHSPHATNPFDSSESTSNDTSSWNPSTFEDSTDKESGSPHGDDTLNDDLPDTDTKHSPDDSTDEWSSASMDGGTESETEIPVSVFCDAEKTQHTTASGRILCCGPDYPVFCDENSDGFDGSCFGDGVDCSTITACGGHWLACKAGQLPFCDEDDNMICHPCPDDAVRFQTVSGRPVCCTEERPQFCDENDSGYSGGCWVSEIDCDTIIPCGDYFSACPSGFSPRCEADHIVCEPPASSIPAN